MEETIININYTEKTIKDLHRNYFRFKNRFFRIYINSMVVIYMFFIMLLLFLNASLLLETKMIVCHLIVLVIGTIFNTHIVADSFAASTIKKSKSVIDKKIKIVFSKDEFIAENGNDIMKMGYDKLYNVLETKEYIYLYTTIRDAIVIEKDLVEDKDLGIIREKLKACVTKYIEYNK